MLDDSRQQVALREVREWLLEDYAGGRHVEPHWQEGPFHLLALSGVEPDEQGDICEDYVMRILLEAHPPLAENVPIRASYGDVVHATTVFPVPEFVWTWVSTHYDPRLQYGPTLHGYFGRYDTLPGHAELFEALADGLHVESYDAATQAGLLQLKESLSQVPPQAVFQALASLPAIETDDRVLETFTALAGVLAT